MFLTNADPVKGFLSLFIGLLLATVGIDPSAGFPRFTFGEVELMQGVNFVATMIGVFAVSELLRNAVTVRDAGHVVVQQVGNMFRGLGAVWRRYWSLWCC